jgi:hypothetical protein
VLSAGLLTSPSRGCVDELARKYEASLLTTGSRFAACADTMCAWVLAEAGKIRYASVSKPVKDLGFWLDFGIDIPRRSVLGQAHHDESTRTYDEVPAYAWTNKSLPGVDFFCEEIIVLPTWSQAVSFIWVDETNARSTDDPALIRLGSLNTYQSTAYSAATLSPASPRTGSIRVEELQEVFRLGGARPVTLLRYLHFNV